MDRLIDSEKHAEYPATRTVVRENGMRIPDPEAFDRPNLSDGVAFGLCLRDDDPAPCRDDERAAGILKKGVPPLVVPRGDGYGRMDRASGAVVSVQRGTA